MKASIIINVLATFTLTSALKYSNTTSFLVHFSPVSDKLEEKSIVLPHMSVIEVNDDLDAEMYPNHLVHVLSTNTYISPVTGPMVANEVSAANEYLDQVKRYEVQFRNTDFLKTPKIPISPCHDSTDGFGGSTGYSATLGFGTSLSLGLDLGTVINNFLSLSLGTSLSNSVSASESISCNVNEGDVVQIFVEPWIVNTDYRYRTYYSLGTVDKKFRKSHWTDFKNNDFPVSITPAPFCVTGVGNVSCSEPPQTKVFLENGAFI